MAMIAEIRLFAGKHVPRGWKECNGETLSVRGNEALYVLLRDSFGGNSWDTFTLPNLAPVEDRDGTGSSRYIICSEGDFPPRD